MKVGKLVVAGMLCLALAGCGSAPAPAPADDAAASSTADATATEPATFGGDQYANVGEGTAFFSCDEGTTENGGTPHLAVNPQKLQAQVSIVTEGIPADKTTYVFVDGKEALHEEMSDGAHRLDLADGQLSDGEHSVEIVQFSDNKTTGDVTFYRVGRYFVG